ADDIGVRNVCPLDERIAEDDHCGGAERRRVAKSVRVVFQVASVYGSRANSAEPVRLVAEEDSPKVLATPTDVEEFSVGTVLRTLPGGHGAGEQDAVVDRANQGRHLEGEQDDHQRGGACDEPCGTAHLLAAQEDE